MGNKVRLATFIALIVSVFTVGIHAAPGDLQIISISTGGTQGNDDSHLAFASQNGRFVGFSSEATNLVAGDTNGQIDIFLRDMANQSTQLLSVLPDGTQSDGWSFNPRFSSDGRYVVFQSFASNFVTNDNNNAVDIFLLDRITGNLTCLSLTPLGATGNGSSVSPHFTANGNFVVFRSTATDLISNDTNGDEEDIYHYDILTGVITLVSIDSNGIQGTMPSRNPSVSEDGNLVVFESWAPLSSADTNNDVDVYLRDIQNGTTTLISPFSNGTGENRSSDRPSISDDGRYIAFASSQPGQSWANIFVLDTMSMATLLVTKGLDGNGGNANSYKPEISGNGRFVAFDSRASNLVTTPVGNDPLNVYLYDTQSDIVKLVSVNEDGIVGDDYSYESTISDDGRYVVFESYAANLVDGDNNNTRDIFLYEVDSFVPTAVSLKTVLINEKARIDPLVFHFALMMVFTIVSLAWWHKKNGSSTISNG